MIKNQVELRHVQDRQQTELLKAVVETQEVERRRLAEDLHDSVGQVLSAIKLNLHRITKTSETEKAQVLLADTRKLTDESIQEIRNIIHNVLPPVLTDFGLLDALKALCEKVEQITGVKVKLAVNFAPERYEPGTELALYRIMQEIFSNAIKHAEATQIQVTLSKEDKWLVILIADNGVGFDLGNVKHGFGLKNLQSRVNLINRKIDYYTKPKHGTLITIKVLIDN